jgi:hypothetical protein
MGKLCCEIPLTSTNFVLKSDANGIKPKFVGRNISVDFQSRSEWKGAVGDTFGVRTVRMHFAVFVVLVGWKSSCLAPQYCSYFSMDHTCLVPMIDVGL